MRLWCDFGGLTPKNADATQEKLIFRPMRDLFAGPIICKLDHRILLHFSSQTLSLSHFFNQILADLGSRLGQISDFPKSFQL